MRGPPAFLLRGTVDTGPRSHENPEEGSMEETVTAALIAIAGGSAAGLRPYFTILGLGLAGMIPLDAAPDVFDSTIAAIPDIISNPWVLGICAILAVLDAGVDKVIGINLPWEAMNSFLRPILAVALGAAIGWDNGTGQAIILGVLSGASALPVSLGKGATTAGLTAVFPEPTSQVVRSLGEDIAAVVMVVLTVLAPILAVIVAIAAIALGIMAFLAFRKAYRSLRRRFGSSGPNRADLEILKREAAADAAGPAGSTSAGAASGPFAAMKKLATDHSVRTGPS